MPRGGKRAGAGRPVSEFREFMRSLADNPEARANAEERVKVDADFWIRCCEQGHGKPGQALTLLHGNANGQPLRFAFPGSGDVLPPSATGLPSSDAGESGE